MGIFGKIKEKLDSGLRGYKLKEYNRKLDEINRFNMEKSSDAELAACSAKLRKAARQGAEWQELMPEAFALVREASARVLGMRHFDVQILAGLALLDGRLVEMNTGEGKTLAAVLTTYVQGLSGEGVHVLTFNDYLAKRDALWMGPLYRFLGLSVGYIQSGMSAGERREAYAADVTYLTAREAGFDFLRDGLCWSKEELVQRPFHAVIVDEADSILIDEARIPLVVAGESEAKTEELSVKLAGLVKELREGTDYGTDGQKRHVFLHEAGSARLEAILGCGNLYDEDNTPLLTAIHCALHAQALVKRDVDYIVRNGKVELIDEFTGRVAENRHWPDGIQAAVEAKEGLERGKGGRMLGTITLEHFIALYPRLAGMTATALTSAMEFKDVYELDVVVIPPNRPNRRTDEPPIIFTHTEAKLAAVAQQVKTLHQAGRPVLIGTASVEESAQLSMSLTAEGIPHQVLNAKNDEQEAETIAHAGRRGAVTVSTNMAGRGVDIRLGDGDQKEWEQLAEMGGLYVIGTAMNESLRIDNQLRGRAGRQGDPGTSQFYIGLEDSIIDRYGRNKAIPPFYLSHRQEEPIGDATVHKNMPHIQRIVQGQNYEMHKHLTRYTEILEEQRQIIHARRMELLEGSEAPAARMLQLYHIDRFWAEHVEFANYLREGIHLESISSKNPIDVFLDEMIRAFADVNNRLEEAIEEGLEGLAKAGGSEQALKALGVKRPGATWTYMVRDNYIQEKLPML